MTQSLIHKHIIVGMTGGIAAYKSADLVRRLKEAGASVRVVMTANAKQFITPLTMQAVSGHPVHDDLFDLKAEAAMGHIELARWADAIVVAPASADFLARVQQHEANDLLTTLCLATKAPLVLAPAMNQGMWEKAKVHAEALQAQGVHIFGPGAGTQACGDVGLGRLLEPVEIVQKLSEIFHTGAMAGKKVVLTAGPTHEHIDPVRFMTNGSSGKMGYALAKAAYEAGAAVTLISGPVHLTKPSGVCLIPVETGIQMYDAVLAHMSACDIFFSVAAVSDFRPSEVALHKIPKNEVSLTLKLAKNPDIVATVAGLPHKPFVVGFAAETTEVLQKARAKLHAKNLDIIIANQVGAGLGMGVDENKVTMLWKEGEKEFEWMSKEKLARELIAAIANMIVI